MAASASEDEDDDIVFDQTVLLNNRRKSSSEFKKFKTVCLCLAFLGLGLCIAIPGPTLEDLRHHVHVSIGRISYIFTARSVGYLIGSIIGGFMFDRWNPQLLLSILLFLTSIATALAPWCKTLSLLAFFISFQGLAMGGLDTGGNVLCLNTWKQNSGPYLQALHFTFGVGAFIAPLIAEPFLNTTIFQNGTVEQANQTKLHPVNTVPHRGKRDIVFSSDLLQRFDAIGSRYRRGSDSNVTHRIKPQTLIRGKGDKAELDKDEKARLGKATHTKVLKKIELLKRDDTEITTLIISNDSVSTTTVLPASETTHSTITKNSNISTTLTPPQTNGTIDTIINMAKSISKVQFAYLVIAVVVFQTSALFLISCMRDRRRGDVDRFEDKPSVALPRETSGFRMQVLILLFVLYFFYVGMEVTFGGFVFSYAIKYLKWSPEKATYLNSLFWGSFAAARGLSIIIAKYASPGMMLAFDLVTTTLSLLGIILSHNDKTMWFLTATLGIGMASIFPTGITWAERYMKITGRAASVFVIGSALGEMAFPAIAGLLFDKKGPMWMIYLLFGGSILSGIIFIILHNLASYRGDKYSQQMQNAKTMSPDEDSMQMKLQNGVHKNKKKVTFKLAQEVNVSQRKPLMKNSSKSD